MTTYAYFVDALQVVRFRGSQGARLESEIKWKIGYATDTRPANDGKPLRVVIATLHASGPTGWAEVDASAFLISAGGEEPDPGPAIEESLAAENIYDFARSHLVGYLVTLGIDAPLPFASPAAEMYTIQVEQGQ